MAICCDKGKCKRRETVTIKMELDATAYDRHAAAVDMLVGSQNPQGNDLLKVNYRFFIEYSGSVVEALTAVKDICADPDVVVSVSCTELEQGRLLVYETLNRLETLIDAVRDRRDS